MADDPRSASGSIVAILGGKAKIHQDEMRPRKSVWRSRVTPPEKKGSIWGSRRNSWISLDLLDEGPEDIYVVEAKRLVNDIPVEPITSN